MRMYQTAQRDQFGKTSIVQMRALSVVPSGAHASSATREPTSYPGFRRP
jgi:hypothetical protein